MSLADDLDQWGYDLGIEVGLPVTRDPATVYPPCLFLGLPSAAQATLSGIALEVPVSLIGPYQGKQAGDILLDSLIPFTKALADRSGSGPAASSVSLGEIDFPAYTATARLYVTEDAPAPVQPPQPGLHFRNDPWVTGWTDTHVGSWRFNAHWEMLEDPPVTVTGYTVYANGTAYEAPATAGRLLDLADTPPISLYVVGHTPTGDVTSNTITVSPPTH